MRARWLIALACIGGMLAVVPHATATIAPGPVAWANPGPMPANGVILIDAWVAAEDVEITLTRDGLPIAGTTSGGHPIEFRPDELLAEGRYQVRVARYGVHQLEIDLEVIAASTPAAHEVDIALSLGGQYVPGGKQVCCEPEPETRSLNNGCFYVDLIGYRTLAWTATSPLPLPEAQQYLYRLIDGPQGSLLTTDFVAFDDFKRGSPSNARIPARADEYCVTAEAKSLIDGSVFTTRACMDDPGTPLDPTPRLDFSYAFDAANCPSPPEGLDARWCDVLERECDREANSDDVSESARAKLTRDCQGYYERCHGSEGAAGAGSAASGSDVGAAANGCSIHRASTTKKAPWALVLMLALALVSGARRLRRRRLSSPLSPVP